MASVRTSERLVSIAQPVQMALLSLGLAGEIAAGLFQHSLVAAALAGLGLVLFPLAMWHRKPPPPPRVRIIVPGVRPLEEPAAPRWVLPTNLRLTCVVVGVIAFPCSLGLSLYAKWSADQQASHQAGVLEGIAKAQEELATRQDIKKMVSVFLSALPVDGSGRSDPQLNWDITSATEVLAHRARAGDAEAMSILRSGNIEDAVRYLSRDRPSGTSPGVATETMRNAAVSVDRWISALALRAGHLQEAENGLQRILVLRPGDRIATLRLAEVFQRKGRYLEARSLYESVRASAGTDFVALSSALNNLGTLGFDQGWSDAEEFLREALRWDIALGDVRGEAAVRGNLGALLGSKNRPVEALEHLTISRDLYAKAVDEAGTATQEMNLAALALGNGKPEEAERHARRGLSLYECVKYAERTAFAKQRLAAILLRQGLVAQAEQYAREAHAFYLTTDDERGIGRSAQVLGNVLAEQKRWKDAKPYYLIAHAKLGRKGNKDEQAVAEGNLALVALYEEQWDTAERHCGNAKQLYRDIGQPLGVAKQDLNLGGIRKARGDKVGARASLTAARDAFGSLGLAELAAVAQREIDGLGDQ